MGIGQCKVANTSLVMCYLLYIVTRKGLVDVTRIYSDLKNRQKNGKKKYVFIKDQVTNNGVFIVRELMMLC